MYMYIDLNDYEEVPENSDDPCLGCAFEGTRDDPCHHPNCDEIIGCANKRIIFVKKEKPKYLSLDEVHALLRGNDTESSEDTEEHNVISKPKHYMLFPEKNIEVRDLMQVLADRLESNGYSAMFISDYIQMQQYLLRFDEKNGKEDLEKAQWYLSKLIESHTKENN